jgi:hypothetical protein
VVSVAQAVIDEYAMMVKLLNASVAKIAVVCVFWSECLARDTHVVKMIVF